MQAGIGAVQYFLSGDGQVHKFSVENKRENVLELLIRNSKLYGQVDIKCNVLYN